MGFGGLGAAALATPAIVEFARIMPTKLWRPAPDMEVLLYEQGPFGRRLARRVPCHPQPLEGIDAGSLAQRGRADAVAMPLRGYASAVLPITQSSEFVGGEFVQRTPGWPPVIRIPLALPRGRPWDRPLCLGAGDTLSVNVELGFET